MFCKSYCWFDNHPNSLVWCWFLFVQKENIIEILKRVSLIISYDGSEYFGLVLQPKQKTVLGYISEVLVHLGIQGKINFAGRTDKGVHALNMNIDFLIPSFWNDLNSLKTILNKKLPNSILVKQINCVQDDFNSRFSSKARVYRYILSNTKSPFNAKYVTYYEDLDFQKITQAITLFIGKHDFSMFKKNGTQTKDNVRTIYEAYCYQKGEFIVFYFRADGFLRSQVRLMVSFLVKIGTGELGRSELEEQLNNKKVYITTPAPANGLYFVRAIYT